MAWLGLLNGELEKKGELKTVYSDARNGRFEIWTSTLSMIECRYIKGEEEQAKPYDESNDNIISELFRQQFIKPVPITVDIAEYARRIWRKTIGLGKFQDALHVASALKWNVETMHTYDKDDLLRFSDKFNCRNGNPLTICYPNDNSKGSLFDRQD